MKLNAPLVLAYGTGPVEGPSDGCRRLR